ncbi:uncharacterized protein TNIN_124281 [Trichonephila inaurata madagascariensis]|uniref:Uncharacterized protein n=1 Tax=Trichonephila inaurata madagascariensis TaxID=2747483 RepID=A0A8X6XCL6_9ARAC|nr:uncharacterized protein TNIN_124281 [Trichonephila inaurata madagascariensis]
MVTAALVAQNDCAGSKRRKARKCRSAPSSKPRRRVRHSHLPYIETHPENEKVFTFFMKALSRSTITGVNRLASSTNIIRKTLWCLVSLFGLIGFMYQAFYFTAVYNSSPTEVVLRVENEGTVTFPSVTEISEEEFIRIHKEALVEKHFDFRYKLGHSNNIAAGRPWLTLAAAIPVGRAAPTLVGPIAATLVPEAAAAAAVGLSSDWSGCHVSPPLQGF